MPTRVDFKREFRELYTAATEPELIDVPERAFAMVDGRGKPNGSRAFADAIGALYTVSYTARFALKRAGVLDYTVMPLEGLYDLGPWRWTLMIMQPDQVTPEVFEQGCAKASVPVRLERLDEGLSAQLMHIGSYSAEAPTVERLHDFIAAEGYEPHGRHHEVYLSDPRRTAPEYLKTIIRQPVRR
jgi:hypothetical protein